jgi:hypothetical protein
MSSEYLSRSMRHHLWANRFSVALLLLSGIMLAWGIAAAISNGPELQFLMFPLLCATLLGFAAWRLAAAIVVVPRQTIVWFRYDRPTFEYRRPGDTDIRSCRTLDVLRVDATTDRRGEIVRYCVRLVDGTRLVIERKSLDNGDSLAERLAADIAHSPRWMFS